MVYLEFDNMLRLGRVQHSAAEIFSHLNSTIGLNRCQLPFATVAELAIDNAWTTDPFDKIIVAQAQANRNAPLITSDSNIAENYAQAVW